MKRNLEVSFDPKLYKKTCTKYEDLIEKEEFKSNHSQSFSSVSAILSKSCDISS